MTDNKTLFSALSKAIEKKKEEDRKMEEEDRLQDEAMEELKRQGEEARKKPNKIPAYVEERIQWLIENEPLKPKHPKSEEIPVEREHSQESEHVEPNSYEEREQWLKGWEERRGAESRRNWHPEIHEQIVDLLEEDLAKPPTKAEVEEILVERGHPREKVQGSLSMFSVGFGDESDESKDTEQMPALTDEEHEAEMDKRQVKMFETEEPKEVKEENQAVEKPKRTKREAVWVVAGTKKPNRLRLLLHELVMTNIGNGMTDNEALEACYNEPRFQHEIEVHPNEKARLWSKEEWAESCKARFRADGKAMMKKFGIESVDDLPKNFPKSFMERERKVDFLTQSFLWAGGDKGKLK